VKVVPIPGSLATSMKPPIRRTMEATVERPRPVPFPGSFVVKRGSKILGRTWAGMPLPESATERTTNGPGATPTLPATALASRWAFSAETMRRPPWGSTASRAFTQRFRRTW